MRYRLYLLNEHGEVRRLVELDAADDDDARLKAKAVSDPHWELLRGSELIAASPPAA